MEDLINTWGHNFVYCVGAEKLEKIPETTVPRFKPFNMHGEVAFRTVQNGVSGFYFHVELWKKETKITELVLPLFKNGSFEAPDEIKDEFGYPYRGIVMEDGFCLSPGRLVKGLLDGEMVEAYQGYQIKLAQQPSLCTIL